MAAVMKSSMINDSSASAQGIPSLALRAPSGMPWAAAPPDPEVVAIARRRQFSGSEKRRLLAEAERCKEAGTLGAFLRRERIYSSMLSSWRKQVGAADRVALAMWYRPIAVLGLLILGAGCADITVPVAQPLQSGSTSVPVAHPTPGLGPTAVAGDLPCVQTRHGCIPLNPDVTEDTVRQTICVPGYTATVRPSSSYTNGIKAKLLRETGLDESLMSEYELDHIVPLALGGHPRKLANLTLQPWEGEHGARRKDLLEHRLQMMVCRGGISLNEAQTCIAEDWEACEAEHMTR